MPGPFGVGEADDELVVGHRQQELVEADHGRRGRAVHFALALGFSWPAASRAAASLSRIT